MTSQFRMPLFRRGVKVLSHRNVRSRSELEQFGCRLTRQLRPRVALTFKEVAAPRSAWRASFKAAASEVFRSIMASRPRDCWRLRWSPQTARYASRTRVRIQIYFGHSKAAEEAASA